MASEAALPESRNLGHRPRLRREPSLELHRSFVLGDREAVIPRHASHPDIAEKPVAARISLVRGFFQGPTLLAEVKLTDSGWKDIALTLAADAGSDIR